MFIYRLLLPLLCCFSLANAEIKEIISMNEVHEHIEKLLKNEIKILVIFDIDDTVATTKEELGSSAWFYRELETQQAQPGVDKQKVFNDIVAFYTHLHNHLPLKAVEKETPDFIAALQYHDIHCIALTARSLLIERTFEQLKHIDINFSRNAPSQNDLTLSDNPELPARYTRGIIFNGDNNKGITLLKYLNAINYIPDHVIYIDDSLKQVQRVHDALEAAGIPCSAFRYGFMDMFNKNLDTEKAGQQLEVFLKKHPLTTA